jgi:hypothetical protein
MWILKGTFLGIWLFSFGTVAFLYLKLFRGLSGSGAVSASPHPKFGNLLALCWSVCCVHAAKASARE